MVERLKLTDAIVAALTPPETGLRCIYDCHQKAPSSFGIWVTPNKIKTFFLSYRTFGGIQRTMKIGRYPDWMVAQARIRAAKIKREVDGGFDPLGAKRAYRQSPTMGELADRYITEHAEPKKRASSVYEDKSLIKKWVRPELGSLKVADVRHRDIVALHRKITAYGTPARANAAIALLSKMFSLSVQWEIRTDNPCRGVERNPDVKRTRFLSPDELKALISTLDAHKNREVANLVRLLLLTGARRGEVMRLRWDQLDLKAATWTKPAHTTKQKALHHVPLSAPALQLLLEIKTEADRGPERAKELEQDALAASSDHHRKAIMNAAARTRLRALSPFVFPGFSGDGHKPMNDIGKSWELICKSASLVDLRLHDLRHSHASLLVAAGVPLFTVGALLGHTQTSTTQRYAHLAVADLREAAEKIGNIVGAANSNTTEGQFSHLNSNSI